MYILLFQSPDIIHDTPSFISIRQFLFETWHIVPAFRSFIKIAPSDWPWKAAAEKSPGWVLIVQLLIHRPIPFLHGRIYNAYHTMISLLLSMLHQTQQDF
jgi:hypothetical protein